MPTLATSLPALATSRLAFATTLLVFATSFPALTARLRALLPDTSTGTACSCRTEPSPDALRVDATDCPGGGDLASQPDCRQTVITALRRSPRDNVVVTDRGLERRYTASATRLLGAAARFADRVEHHDERLADLATHSPPDAAAEIRTRVGPVTALATKTGLLDAAETQPSDAAYPAYVGPTIASARVRRSPPPDARLRSTYDLDTATVRIYDTDAHPVPTYHLDPPEAAFETVDYRVLRHATDVLSSGQLGDGEHVHHAAIRTAITELDCSRTDCTVSLDTLALVLAKHTAGYGVIGDLFADPDVGSVFVNAPADETTVRVLVDDEPMRTNVSLTSDGTAALASRIRAQSGRAFSSAAPLVDAVADDLATDDRVRVAGVTDPVTPGTAFALRRIADDRWRLDDLVANDTLTAESAALLSLAVERGRRILVAGPRGAGKTTLLGALLWELPPTERLVVIEDTPELPVADLQSADRDALALRTSTDEDGAAVSPADALRAALRLGDGALAVGEVRGEEAAVLYEAMRVGANSSAVLGTIHGDGGQSVEERVVSDLGVPRSSFAATDLVATVGHTDAGRRLVAIEEVLDEGFATLYEYDESVLHATDRIRRGNSRFITQLATPAETYADVRDSLAARTNSFQNETPAGGHKPLQAGGRP